MTSCGVQGELRFDGPDYVPELDAARLGAQLERVKRAMLEGAWLTLPELHELTGDPEASISAQLRHLRKPRFGAWLVHKRRRGSGRRGLFEYRLEARA